jgi:rhodanese-related sulfurtransferase
VAAGIGTWLIAENPDFDAMKRTIRRKFPDVPQISTGELAKWLNDPKRQKPVLLDVRTEKEFEVSHLHGAVRVDPSVDVGKLIPQLPQGKPIVTYCSVGYRSSSLAEKLKKAGVASVVNLEGSIFQWANEARPLEADGHPTDKVDPYNAKFGKMLNEDKRASQ